MQEIDLFMQDQATSTVENLSREAGEEVDAMYDEFFYEIMEMIGGNEVPIEIAGYTGWEDLSGLWTKEKIRFGRATDENQAFYIGITRELAAGGRIVRGKKRRKKAVKVKPFKEYISSLQKAGTVDRFFGPVTLKYEFQSERHEETVKVRTGKVSTKNPSPHRNQITSVTSWNIYMNKRMKNMRDYRVIGQVNAFEKLLHIDKTEHAIVDFILRKIDPGNKKQWQKINGTSNGRGVDRPIRALILPMVQYYINDKLTAAMRRVMRS